MAVLVTAFGWSAEGRLQSEAIYQIELLPHHDTSGCFSSLLNGKIAPAKSKVFRVLREQKRKDALFKPVCLLVGTAVHEKILGSGVTMYVTVEENVSRVLRFLHHNFCGVVFGTLFHRRCNPLTIQVQRRQGTSIVSDDNSIRIQHRYNFKHEVIAQVTSALILRNEVFQCALDDE